MWTEQRPNLLVALQYVRSTLTGVEQPRHSLTDRRGYRRCAASTWETGHTLQSGQRCDQVDERRTLRRHTTGRVLGEFPVVFEVPGVVHRTVLGGDWGGLKILNDLTD